MVAFTPVFALPYENPGVLGVPGSGDQPGVTLHGGVPPSSPILAEEVENVLVGQAADVVTLDSRVTALELQLPDIRWRHIEEGTQVGAGNRTLVVPAGFLKLRLTLQGAMTATANVNLRVNGDATAGRHIWGFDGFNAGSETILFEHSGGAATVWKIGAWGVSDACMLQTEIYPTDGGSMVSYQSQAMQLSGTASLQRVQLAGGRYDQLTAVTSLEVIQGSGQTFTSLRWLLEGYLA